MRGLLIAVVVVISLSVNVFGFVTIDADNPNIQYTGRINHSDPKAPIMYWPGSDVIANFEGTSINVKLNDLNSNGNAANNNYYYVIIDDGAPSLLTLTPGARTYTADSGLTDTVHKIRLFKRTETQEGEVEFLGFELDDGKTLVAPPARSQRRIEYYGDSITSGHSVAVPMGQSDTNDAWGKDNYYAYSSVTARNLEAEYHCISVSGIGLYVDKWGFGGNMQTLYYDKMSKYTDWDFSQWTPQIVVINLGTNDSGGSYTQAGAESNYIAFAQTLRGEYPDAYIIIALGDMMADTSPWHTYVQNAVAELNTTYGDDKVYGFSFLYGGSGHPRVERSAAMADQLTEFIQTTIPGFGNGPDVNVDDYVNNQDFAEVGKQWQLTGCGLCGGADMTDDGNVTIDDLRVVALNWLEDFAFIGHWKLDVDAADSSGDGNDGTAVGTPTYNPTGHVDGSVVLDGSTYFQLQNFACVTGKQSRTVEGWIKTTSGKASIMTWGDYSSDGAKWKFFLNDLVGTPGAIQLDVQGGRVVGSTDVTDGQWHHVAAILKNDGTPNADEVELYVDGKEEDYSSVTSYAINTAVADASLIGALKASSESVVYKFTGEMDDMRLYSRAFSANQMAAKNGWDGLLAHWPLDSDATDIGGDAHNGTEFGGMTYSAGKVGSGGAVLDGSDDYIQMIGYKGPSGNRSRTVAAWIKTSSSNPQEIVSWGDSGDSVRWKFQIVDGFGTDGALQLDVSNGRVVGSTDLRDGMWHHVAAVLEDDGTPNADEVKLYVDGNLEAISDSAPMPVLTGNVNDVYIGGVLGSSVVYNFNGMIDDVRLYGIALSQAQIDELASM